MIKQIFVISVLLFVGFKGVGQTEKKLFKIADSLFNIKAYEQAIPYYDKLIAKNDTNQRYFRSRGFSHIALNHLEQGKTDYQKALKLNPACSNCYVHLARIEATQNNLDKSLKLLDMAILKDENNAYAYSMRAEVKELSNDAFGASLDYSKAIELQPKNAYNYMMRAKYYWRQNYQAFALDDFNKAVSLAPKKIEIIQERLNYFLTFQKWEKALKDLDTCIELDPQNTALYSDKGNVLGMLGKAKEALEYHNKALSLEDSDYTSYYNRSLVYYQLENMDKVCEDRKKALILAEKNHGKKETIKELKEGIEELCNPDKASYYYQRGIANYNLSNFEKAVKYYEEGLKKFPQHSLMLSFKANALMAMNQHESAIVNYKKSLKYQDNAISEQKKSQNYQDKDVNFITASYLSSVYSKMSEAYIYLQKNKIALALADSSIQASLEYQNQFLELKNEISYSHNLRGIAYANMEKYKEAEKAFLESIKYNRNNPYPYINLARLNIGKHLAKQNTKKQTILGLQINDGYGINSSIKIPLWKKEDINTEVLRDALNKCDKAIAIDKNYAYAYLLRAKIKILLNYQDYCLDALRAKSLGIQNAEQILEINCE